MSNYLPHQYPVDCLPIFGRCVGIPRPRVSIEYADGTPRITGSPTFGDAPLILPAELVRRASTIGAPPRFGSRLWPDSLVIVVRVDSAGAPVAGRGVSLTATAIDELGAGVDRFFGHFHAGANGATKPPGVLSGSIATTSADGTARVTFRPSIVSGPVVLRAMIGNADPAADTAIVGVPGLIQLQPSASFDTVGTKAIHPVANWVTPTMHQLLTQLADEFHATFRRKLEYNDASLSYGGKFDILLQWGDPTRPNDCMFRRDGQPPEPAPNGCHGRHRLGRDIDLRTRAQPPPNARTALTDAQLVFIRERWHQLSRSKVVKEGDHYHLPYRR